jgi:diacylglycerol kinase family enzyme
MKLVVVLNRKAGTLLGESPEAAAREVETRFAAAGAEARVTLVGARNCRAALVRAAASDAEAIVVGGGDGTVRTAAQFALDSGKALGVLPLGTVNLLARDLDVPFDLRAAIDALGRAEIRRVDVAEVNGRIFLSTSGLGFFVEMAEAREQWRASSRYSKWLAFAGALSTALGNAPEFEVDVDTGAGLRRVWTRAVLVTNNLYEDVPGLFAKRKRLDRGELAVHIGRHRSWIGVLRAAALAINGGWSADRAVETIRTASFTVLSRRRRVRVSSDGEIDTLDTPLHYRVRPQALAVLAPRAAEAAVRKAM